MTLSGAWKGCGSEANIHSELGEAVLCAELVPSLVLRRVWPSTSVPAGHHSDTGRGQGTRDNL